MLGVQMKKWLVAAFIFLAFFTAGCALPLSPEEKLGQHDITVPKYSDPADYVCEEVPGGEPCTCMYCEGRGNWVTELAKFIDDWFDANLGAGNCRFESCNMETYLTELEKDSDIHSRTFMLGQGPSFVSTDSANLYCEYSLQLATKWMKGDNFPPRVPLPSRAKCWLERNILPVFMYYTGSTAIDPYRTGEIAQAFDQYDQVWPFSASGVGPALITTEVDFDSSDPANIELVKQQIIELDKCDKCLTVLAVKSNDMHALEQILGIPPNWDMTYYDKVDIIGFGFRANDYETCNQDKILYENIKFSRDILKNYHKPTIILYVGASEGNNIAGTCEWSAEKVHNFYQTMFALTQSFASSGIIAMSFYEFVDGTGPLPCDPDVQGCNFGLFNADGTQKHPELNTWSHLCQYYGVEEFRNPLVYSTNGFGQSCDFMQTNKMSNAISYEMNTQQGLKTDEVKPIDKEKKLNCGEVCPSEFPMHRQDVFDNTGNHFSSRDSDGNGIADHCELYPTIEEKADDEDVSATYFRAMLEQESNFKQYAVSCKNPVTSKKCNVYKGPDPNHAPYYSMAEICAMAGNPPDCPRNFKCPSGKKPCAFGVAQCIELPGEVNEFTRDCGGTSYYPFDPSMSVCCGINKLREALDRAEVFVANNWAELSKCTDGLDDKERGWTVYYLASNAYYGAGQGLQKGVLNTFVYERDKNSDCDGEQNYIEYLKKTYPPNKDGPNNEYGAQIMSRFLDAVEVCDSDCPGRPSIISKVI